MNTKHTFVGAIGSLLVLAPLAMSHAQQETDSARAERHAHEGASLAKAAQNPVANMVSLPLQYNFTTAGGLDSSTVMVLNVQPVIPVPIGKHYMIVARTIVPFISVPLPADRVSDGIGDILEEAFLVPTKPAKLTWGVGPIFSFPTATATVARTGQWGLGPTAVGLVMPGHWVIGALANNIWRIGGDAHGEPLNSFLVQPFVNYNLPLAWAISTAPAITANWSAASGERWTVPIGIGVSKVTHVGDQPFNLLAQYYHNLSSPSRGGRETLRLEVTALWPTAAAEAARKKAEAEAARRNSGRR